MELNCDEVNELLDRLLPNDVEETKKMQRILDAGARDGVNGKKDFSVDGHSWLVNLNVLRDIRNVAMLA